MTGHDLQRDRLCRTTRERTRHDPKRRSPHDAGIAAGRRLEQAGTTLSELKQYHLETLNVVLEAVNREAAEIEAREQARREREAQERAATRNAQEHQISDINESLKS